MNFLLRRSSRKVGALGFAAVMCAYATARAQKKTIFDFEAKDIDGNLVQLSKYKDNVVLIVNTASK